MNNKHPSVVTWDYLEKYMAANPAAVLSIYSLEHAIFLDDEPVFMEGPYWNIDHKKFKRVSSNIFGLVKFMIRDERKQRIADLTPGLEMDKLIGRHVLGWQEWSVQAGRKTNPHDRYDRSLWWDEDGSGPVHLNRFSTDIKAAWDLAEKFKFCVVPMGDHWTAVRLGQILVDGEINKAPTAPHAICLAALFYASEDGE